MNARIIATQVRLDREYNERITLAYHMAKLPLMKKFPDLEKLLVQNSRKAPRKQSWEEQLAIAQQWTAATSR